MTGIFGSKFGFMGEKLFMNEHPERRKLICPVEPLWEQQIQEWESREYKQKEFRINMSAPFI